MNTRSDLTIAIISYNSFDTIKSCLNELIKSNKFNIVIIDNASPDGSGSQLATEYSDALVLQEATNLGYGKAANVALRKCNTPYLLLINPDLKATPHQVEQLLKSIKFLNKDTALLAPAVSKDAYTQKGVLESNWVIGAAMMFDVKLISEVGFFDENIFLFYEETDLCIRIRNHGYKVKLDSNIYIEHLYGQSSTPNPDTEALKDWHYGWSKMYYLRKHGMDKGKNNLYVLFLKYRLKYALAYNQQKKMRYKYRAQGCWSYLKNPQNPRQHTQKR